MHEPSCGDLRVDSSSVTAQNKSFPLRIGCEAEFGRAMDYFRARHFDEPTVCNLLKLERISDFEPADARPTEVAAIESVEMRTLLRLFLYQETLEWNTVEQWIPAVPLEAFLSLDLLRREEMASNDGSLRLMCYSPVFLNPIGETIVASDRNSNPDGALFEPATDFVYPAIVRGTSDFLGLQPLMGK